MSEVRAAATPDLDALALLAGKDAEAVVLDLMQPIRPGRRATDKLRITGDDEHCRRISPDEPKQAVA